MKFDAAFNRRALRYLEAALDVAAADRDSWITETLDTEPALRDAVRELVEADRSAHVLPTQPPDPHDEREAEPTPARIGHYRIIRELGRGGMGVVYLAERDDGLFEHRVAIKLMRRALVSEHALTLFAAERRILARLRHPHISQLYDGGVTEDERSYIVMERIVGTPITEYCARRGADLATRLSLFREAGAAIEHAHRNLIVHADIKPGNVVVEDGFGVKLLDFGIARLLDEVSQAPGHAFTPAYSSPARTTGQPATPTDDIYSAGVLLAELIDGQPGVDGDLRAIVATATAPDPAQRYGAIGELTDDVEAWRTHRPVRAAPPGRRRAALLFWRRNRLGLSLSGALVAGLAVAFATISFLYLQSEHRRVVADQRYTSSLRMADYIIGNTDPALARTPGALPVRKQLVEQTAAYLHNLESNRSSSPALTREIAAGYLRMAKIYGLDPSGGIGDMRAAKASLEHADTLIAAAQVQAPDAPDLLWLRGQARLLEGTRVFIEPTGDVARESLKALAEARSYLRAYLKLRPHDTEARLALWSAELMPERAYYYLGRPLDGVAGVETHLDMARLPVQTPAQRKERDFNTNASYLLLGEGYTDAAPRKALLYFGILIDQAARMQRQGDSDWENDLTQASGFADRAAIEADHGDVAAALRDNKTAIATLQRLYSVEHNQTMAMYLSYIRLHLATLLARTGRLTEALAISGDNIAWLRRYVAEDHGDASRERLLAIALTARATIEGGHDAHKDACAAVREAATVWRVVQQHHGTTAEDVGPDGGIAKMARLGVRECPPGAS